MKRSRLEVLGDLMLFLILVPVMAGAVFLAGILIYALVELFGLLGILVLVVAGVLAAVMVFGDY